MRVNDPTKVRYELEKATQIARSERPGLVWIDVPMDVQSASVIVDDLPGYDPINTDNNPEEDIENVLSLLKSARRPVIIVGRGIVNGIAIAVAFPFRQFPQLNARI